MAEAAKEYVTSEMMMGEVLAQYPQAAYALMACGLGCVSCPSAQMETVSEAAMVHGLDPVEVLAFVNEWIGDKLAEAANA